MIGAAAGADVLRIFIDTESETGDFLERLRVEFELHPFGFE